MKLFFGLITGFLTLAVGILSANLVTTLAIRPAIVDKEYSFGVDELVSKGDTFDGRSVRVHGTLTTFEHHPNFANLNGTGANWIGTICVADEKICSRIRPTRSNFDDLGGFIGPQEFYVEVVGRYRANAIDPHPEARGGRVHLLEISDVIYALSDCEELRDKLHIRGCGSSGRR